MANSLATIACSGCSEKVACVSRRACALRGQVAVKVLSMCLTGENVEHFRTEAHTVARLVHSHIVRVLDFGVEDATPYLVMDDASLLNDDDFCC